MSKNLFLILCLLLSGLALSSRAEAGLDPILTAGGLQPSLAYGNGNKIVNTRFNHLLAVYASSTIQYGSSDVMIEEYDPINATWTDHQLTADGVSYQPTVAVDNSSGLAVVAWVNRSYILPSVWYAYQTQINCASCWSQPQEIVFLGSELSIAVDNGTVHLAWTTRDRVHYTSFPMTAPPFGPMLLGDVVDTTNCSSTGFFQPSLALAHPPCGPLVVRIAALLASNEQNTAGPCHATDTKAGPRIYEKDNNTLAWSQVFQEVVSDPAPGQPFPTPFSISMNANRLTGDFYLAWSEEQNQVARTKVGHGKGNLWDATQLIDNQQHNIHLAAKGAGNAGHFRLAVSDPDWSTSGYSQTGKWGGGSLNWTGSSISIPDSIRPFIGHPEALYWSRCTHDTFGSTLSEIKVYTEAGPTTFPPTEMATDLSQSGTQSCRLATLPDAALPHCFEVNLSVSRMSRPEGGDAVLVDVGDYAIVTQLSSTGAVITTLAGETIQATWSAGDVISFWDNGFVITASRENLKFTSKDARFQVLDLK